MNYLPIPAQSYFITGTDTGVGKTFVTTLLAKQFLEAGKTVCIYKPVQTGASDCSKPDDLEAIKIALAKLPLFNNLAFFNTYCFSIPAAPSVSDIHQEINPAKIIADFKKLQSSNDIVLVEGAGGVLVPITDHYDMRDLMVDLELPILLVSRPDLGTINHTRLSVEALTQKSLTVSGVIVSGVPEGRTLSLREDAEAIHTLPQQFSQWLSDFNLFYLPQLSNNIRH